MAKLLGKKPALEEVAQKVVDKFVDFFPGKWREISPDQVFTGVQMQNAKARAVVGSATAIIPK